MNRAYLQKMAICVINAAVVSILETTARAQNVAYSPVIGAGAGTPGNVQWHGGDTPFLSVEGFDGTRRAVVDPFAMHRETWTEIDPPEYALSADAGVATSNGWWVMFDQSPRPNPATTRSVTLTPVDGWTIRRVDIEDVSRNATIDVDCSGGRAVVRAETQNPAPGDTALADCAFRIVRVLAVRESTRLDTIDDLTQGDYRYRDPLGETSLGGLRPWINGQLAGHRGDDWSRYLATTTIRLGGQPVVVDALAQFRIESGVESDSRDRMTLYAGSSPAVELSLGAEANGGNGAVLRIMRFEFDRETRRVEMSVTAIGENHVIIGTDSALTDDPILWRDLETTRLLGTTTIDGVTCYTLQATVPDTWDMAFFRAGCDIDDSNPTTLSTLVPVVAREGVILRSPNGTLWRLKVANDGTLSTEAY